MLTRRLAAALLMLVIAAPGAAAQTDDVEIQEDVRYTAPGELRLTLDAYLPPGEGPFPAVVVIPGGGWSRATKDLPALIELSTTLAQNGFATFAIDYRVSLRAPYPAAVEDVQTAISWIRDNAATFRVSPDRIGAIGHSAGGHLAALAATLGQGPLDQGARIAAAVSMSGPMDLEPLLDAEGEVLEAVQTFLDCPVIDEGCVQRARAASPVNHVDPSDAPIQLFNSTEEMIPAEQATSMAEALESAGVPHQLTLIPGDRHAYLDVNQPLTPQGTVLQSVQMFLADRLGGEVPTPITASPSVSPTLHPARPAEDPILQRERSTRLLMLAVSLAALAAGGGILGVRIARNRRERRELMEVQAQVERESGPGRPPAGRDRSGTRR